MYSQADQTQYLVNRIRLKNGNWEPEPALAEVEKHYSEYFLVKMAETIGHFGCELESREEKLRREETNMGNFIADLMRTEYYCDFAFINAGCFRKNTVIPAGYVNTMALYECFPFNDPVVVLRMKGSVLKEALEWSVGAYPAEEGKFPQISNLNFLFDPSKPSGSRIDPYDIGSESNGLLSMDDEYTVAMTLYTANGGDGFTMFKEKGVE